MAKKIVTSFFFFLGLLEFGVCETLPLEQFQKSQDAGKHYEKKKETYKNSTPTISIIVADVGLNQHDEELLNQLPAGVAFALSIFGDVKKEWIEKAAKQGHMLLLSAPFRETTGNKFDSIFSTFLEEKNLKEWLQKNRNSVKGFLVDDSLEEKKKESLIQAALKEKMQIFAVAIDGDLMGKCNQSQVACQNGDVVIYSSDELGSIRNKLDGVKMLAQKQGHALLTVFIPNKDKLKLLVVWMLEIKKLGINLLSLEELIKKENKNGI